MQWPKLDKALSQFTAAHQALNYGVHYDSGSPVPALLPPISPSALD